MTVHHTIIESPVGELTLFREGSALTAVYFADHAHGAPGAALDAGTVEGFEAPIEQLSEYFAGERTVFDLELAPHGDEFQQRVWMQLRTIPYGQTRSYGEVAKALGDAHLSRAVGVANSRNPLSIVVPCHRVIGADGSLTGYGGGLARKAFLLELEESAEAKAARLF
jgi:methylated-DNA-[protein]-cysteine S-methyltransferase